MNLSWFQDALLPEAIWSTLQLLGGGLGLGLTLALAYLFLESLPIFGRVISSWQFVLRSVPFIVQLYLLYFGLAQCESLQNSCLWPLLSDAKWCAITALGINSSAYTAVILKAAYASIPAHYSLAARALGLSPWQTFWFILRPVILDRIWPTYTNEILMVLKSTTLASTITVLDLMGFTRQWISTYYEPMQGLIYAGIAYCTIASGLLGLMFLAQWGLVRRKKWVR